MAKFIIDTAWFFDKLREKGYSLRRFSGDLGMDPSAVSRMLNGQRNMSADEQDRVARLLGLPLYEVAAHRGVTAGAGGFGEMAQAGYGAAAPKVTSVMPTASSPNDGLRDPLFGCMKGTMTIPDDLDLTAPADPDWGKVYDDD